MYSGPGGGHQVLADREARSALPSIAAKVTTEPLNRGWSTPRHTVNAKRTPISKT